MSARARGRGWCATRAPRAVELYVAPPRTPRSERRGWLGDAQLSMEVRAGACVCALGTAAPTTPSPPPPPQTNLYYHDMCETARRGGRPDAAAHRVPVAHGLPPATHRSPLRRYAFYTKFMWDIEDGQDTHGRVPDCTPFYGHGSAEADAAWSAAWTFMPAWLSSYGADDRVIAEHYLSVRTFVGARGPGWGSGPRAV